MDTAGAGGAKVLETGIVEWWSNGLMGINPPIVPYSGFAVIPAKLAVASASRNPGNTRKPGLPLPR
jgi:hypothetical protein